MRVETSWQDFRLGLRMLVKHPVLTLIATVATTLAIGAGAAYFEINNDVTYPTLPLEDGMRVVTVQTEDLEAAAPERRVLHDFLAWRDELTSVQDLAALTIYSRNLGHRNPGQSSVETEPVEVVEISAAAFRVARIPPLLGRALVEADEQAGAAPVVVIGERLWEARFQRDPGIVGQTVELGLAAPTVVGVMPKSFALPVNQSLWVPFRIEATSVARRQGPAVRTIGRLAPGVTIEQAQAELAVVGQRLATRFPDTHARLQPRVMPYLAPFGATGLELNLRRGLNAVFAMLLIVICGNVGALVFARIATRENELIVRTALGASRGRIVMQMFIEALVLTSTGAVVALAVLRWGLRRAEAMFWAVDGVTPPFWRNDDINVTTVIYVGLLTLLGAVVTGVLPALRLTRGGLESNLRRGAVGGSGMASRKMSTAVIVTQVALCGALLPLAMSLTFQLNWSEQADIGIRTGEYLTLRYRMEEPFGVNVQEAQAAMSTRFETTFRTLKGRLLDRGFSVTFTNQLPGSSNPGRLIEVVGDPTSASEPEHRVRAATVDAGFFEAMNATIVAGRTFHAADAASGQNVVIVNQPFVRDVLGGRNAVGRRLRYTGSDGAAPRDEFEIVGVVPDLGMSPLEPAEAKGIYHVAAPGAMPSGFMAIHVGQNPGAAAGQVRSIAAAVDPNLLIYNLRPLNEVHTDEMVLNRIVYLAMALGVYFIVLLSAAVTFALMSFTVSQRTREIGIRKALGAGPRPVLASVFSRAFVQLGLGAGLGAFLSIAVISRVPDSYMTEPGMIAAIMAFMVAVGFLSCVAPALRVLRIEPTVAMRVDQ